MNKIRLFANAKINLTLDIVGLRADGYHLLESVMQTISLHDEICIEKTRRSGIMLACPGMRSLEYNKNTAYLSAVLFFEALNFLPSVKITIKKNLPSRAGMGGGSADAAATLVGLNKLYGEPFSIDELKAMAVKVGADVPFLIEGGIAFCEGIGEKLTPLKPLKPCYFVIFKGKLGNHTQEIFEKYDSELCEGSVDNKKALEAIKCGRLRKLSQAMGNILEKPAELPDLELYKKEGSRFGALKTQMTGSGSAIFSMFKDKKKAERFKEYLEKSYPELSVYFAVPKDRCVEIK